MTREEAKKLMHRGIPFPDQLRKIDMIYDDFEVRVCENCAYYFPEEGKCSRGWKITEKDFGCNKFERVQDGTE